MLKFIETLRQLKEKSDEEFIEYLNKNFIHRNRISEKINDSIEEVKGWKGQYIGIMKVTKNLKKLEKEVKEI